MPVRRTLWTGRRIVPTHYYRQPEPVQLPGWHRLYNEDVTLGETLTQAGYSIALIADLPHLQRPGHNFHKGYGYYELIRGQEIDYYAQAPRKQPDFADLYPADFLEKVDVGVPADGLERLRANYAGEASNVDYGFGKILDKVAELGLNENTVVVFLSDHGALLGEQGQFVKGPER